MGKHAQSSISHAYFETHVSNCANTTHSWVTGLAGCPPVSRFWNRRHLYVPFFKTIYLEGHQESQWPKHP